MSRDEHKPTGRRSICTPELTERICTVLQAGNYIEAACAYCGISVASFHAWRVRGEDELERRAQGEEPDPTEQKFVSFLEATTRARAGAEVEAVALLRQAAQAGNIQAMQFFLERSYPDRWGRRKVEHEHTGDLKVKLKFNVPTPPGEVQDDED